MNRKGFTLIELLAVVVILAIIALITVPAVSRYILSTRDSGYAIAEKSMVSSARNLLTECEGKMYGDSSLSYCAGYPVPEKGNSMVIPLQELITYGYIEPVEDPGKTGEYCYADKSYVKITNTSSNDVNVNLEYNSKLYCPSKEYEAEDVTENTDNNFVVLITATHDGKNYEYGTWVTGSVNVQLTTTYTEAQITKYQYKLNNSEWRDISPNGEFNISTSVNGKYQFKGVAANGKESSNVDDYKLIRIDNTDPRAVIDLSGDKIVENADAFKTNVTARCGNAKDEHSGVKTCGISLSSGGPFRESVTLTEETLGTMVYLSMSDNVGHSYSTSKNVIIDRTPPTLNSITAIKGDNSTYTSNTWTDQTVKILGNASDNLGIAKIIYTPNGESSVELDPGVYYEITNTKNTTITVQARDKAGHLSNTLTIVVKVDKDPPEVTVTGNPTAWKPSATLEIHASDNGSGLVDKPYSFDNGSTWVTTASKKYTANENVTIKVKDSYGHVTTKTVNITKVDSVPPTYTHSQSGNKAKIACKDQDNLSGLKGGTKEVTMSGSSYTISTTCEDNAGNKVNPSKTYYYNASPKCGTLTVYYDCMNCQCRTCCCSYRYCASWMKGWTCRYSNGETENGTKHFTSESACNSYSPGSCGYGSTVTETGCSCVGYQTACSSYTCSCGTYTCSCGAASCSYQENGTCWHD